MRKSLLFFLLLFVCSVSLAHAKEESTLSVLPTTKSVGVVIVGAVEFRAPDYIDIINETLSQKFSSPKYKLVTGNEPQNKYQNYWDNKGFLTEQPATKADLLSFSQQSTYDSVLFLILSAPATDVNRVGGGWGYGWSVQDKTRATIEVRAMLIDSASQQVTANLTTAQNDDSLTSALRAKRGAFKKAMEYIAANMTL